MNGTDLLPLLILASIPVLTLLQRSVFQSTVCALSLSIIGYLLTGITCILSSQHLPLHTTPLIILDRYGCYYGALISAAALTIALFSYSYIKNLLQRHEEFYIFLSLATLGATTMALSEHFAAFFLGLETVSVSLYVLIAYKKTDLRGLEGSLKYLVLAGVSSAFLLFGLAMLYLETGTLALAPISSPDSPFVLASLAMIFVGIGFKLAIVPFYLWTPDIYQGAPAPVTAFIATISKGAVFVFFVRFFTESSLPYLPVLSWIAIASMLIGNLLALLQDNIKRLLGYSSIAHLGYLLVACIAGGRSAQEAIAFYLAAYFITTLGAFCVITALSSKDGDAELLSSYRGLAWRHPFLAAVLTLTFFSLAGLPISAGFLGKFYLLRAAIFSNLYPIAITLILTSILGLFYYLRVIITLFAREEQELPYTFSKSSALALLYLTLLLLWLGAYPQGFVDLLSFCALSTENTSHYPPRLSS